MNQNSDHCKDRKRSAKDNSGAKFAQKSFIFGENDVNSVVFVLLKS